jgi:hypothetical protein
VLSLVNVVRAVKASSVGPYIESCKFEDCRQGRLEYSIPAVLAESYTRFFDSWGGVLSLVNVVTVVKAPSVGPYIESCKFEDCRPGGFEYSIPAVLADSHTRFLDSWGGGGT